MNILPICRAGASRPVAASAADSLPAHASARNRSSPGFDAGAVLRCVASADRAKCWRFDMNRIVTQQTRLIRYQATEYQRKVAEAARPRVRRRATPRATKPKATPAKPRKRRRRQTTKTKAR